MESSVASLRLGESPNLGGLEEVKRYRIHVSSKYLELTRKKLELTRLPHEILLPPSRAWEHGTPKSEIEPLIDYWLENYDWRTTEQSLNEALPQFRTAIVLKTDETTIPMRLHFLHLKSPSRNAVPLLLLPPFPLTNLSLSKLIELLISSPSPDEEAFDLVIPSLPGLGFSDAFVASEGAIKRSAGLLDQLMARLGYEDGYLCSMTGAGRETPGEVDYWLAKEIGTFESCVGLNLIEPCVEKPKNWLGRSKFELAKFFHANAWGYEERDFLALKSSSSKASISALGDGVSGRKFSWTLGAAKGGGKRRSTMGVLGMREPNTFAYALCDSPVGLLSLVVSALRSRNKHHTLTPTEIVDATQLAWLPGPEAGMRFWSSAVQEIRQLGKDDSKGGSGSKSKVAVTVFGSDAGEETGVWCESNGLAYLCPAWVGEKFDVCWTQRVQGRPGLLVWERPEVIVKGIRGLAREVLESDVRSLVKHPKTVRIDGVTIDERASEDDVESPDTIVAVQMS